MENKIDNNINTCDRVCPQCGSPLFNTIGGNYHCKKCGYAVNDLVYRPQYLFDGSNNATGTLNNTGWICPICHRGVAPFVSVCPCASESSLTEIHFDITGSSPLQ